MSDISRQLTGSPWHVEKWTREEGDDRRHKSRCVYFERARNYCNRNYSRCCGSAHCKYYKVVDNEEIAEPLPKKEIIKQASKGMENVFYVTQKVKSRAFGFGIIIDISSNIMTIHFENGEVKKFDVKTCAEKQIIVPV